MTEERTFEEQVELSSLENIKTEGISVRVGNQIVHFEAANVQDITVEQEVRNEFQEGYDAEVQKLARQYDDLKDTLKDQYLTKNQELDRKERDLNKRLSETVQLPTITEDFLRKGLSVSRRNEGYRGDHSGYLWSYVCVYAPKYVSNKVIDPAWAKRLMTPIRIFVYTDAKWGVTEVRLVKLINCDKFQHYHSLSRSSDCWGGMKFSGEVVDTPEKALAFIKNIQIVLETINRMSIGQRAPKGLSRLATVEKHLLSDRPDPENNGRSTTNSRRNDRAGFDESVNDEVTAELWTT
jgi:hypothetical protein